VKQAVRRPRNFDYETRQRAWSLKVEMAFGAGEGKCFTLPHRAQLHTGRKRIFLGTSVKRNKIQHPADERV